jgi:pimeloyl-ACP methyl ester carboxylesterase
MPDWPKPSMVRVADGDHGPIDLSVHEAGTGPAVLFCHGFPELAFSWRHQLSAVAQAGYRAIAPDMRGYGRSSRPDAVDAYGIEELCGDLVGLLDALGLDKAVFVGHDWGGFVTWAMGVLHPDRVAGLVGVCTPYMSMAPTSVMREIFPNDEDFYILWFQPDSVAESVMDPKADALFRALLRGGISPERIAERMAASADRPPMNPFIAVGTPEAPEPMGDPVLDEDELAVYIDAYRRTGFRGGINWYRNIDANVEPLRDVGEVDLPFPCLMLCAEWDFALRPDLADPMMSVLSDVERHDIPEAGHWVTQEAPETVNAHLVDWLTRRFPS